MRVAVVAGPGGGCWLAELAEDGTGHGPVVWHDDCPAAVAAYERSGGVRWVWAAAAGIYPALLRAGVRVERCHDIALTEALLLAREGRPGEPASLAGAWARLRGAAAPAFPGGRPAAAPRPGQDALFDPADPVFPDPGAALDAVIEVHAGQQRRIAADEHPGRFALLVAAESAGGLIAAEMGFDGLPWRADVHDELLTELLGPRPVAGMRPAKVADLAARISACPRPSGEPGLARPGPAGAGRQRGAGALDPVRGAARRGSPGRARCCWSTRSSPGCTRRTAGPGWTSGWRAAGSARSTWSAGWCPAAGPAAAAARCRSPGCCAGRWWPIRAMSWWSPTPRSSSRGCWPPSPATARWPRRPGRGTCTRRWPGRSAATGAQAKVALLSAMYGGAGGEAGQLLAVLRRRFPLAAQYVEAAARAGEEGRVVRSRLGRTCPPPSDAWRGLTAVRGRPGRGGGAGGPVAAGPRPFHPQLCRAGERGRLGDRAAGRPPPPPGGDFTAKRNGRPPRCPCREPAG